MKQTELFAVAGIWEEWNYQKTFSLITQHPNDVLLTVHDRMPGILLPNQEKAWLESKTGEEAIAMIHPYPQEKMEFYTVSKRLNSSFDNDPTLLLPATHDDRSEFIFSISTFINL